MEPNLLECWLPDATSWSYVVKQSLKVNKNSEICQTMTKHAYWNRGYANRSNWNWYRWVHFQFLVKISLNLQDWNFSLKGTEMFFLISWYILPDVWLISLLWSSSTFQFLERCVLDNATWASHRHEAECRNAGICKPERYGIRMKSSLV